MHEVSLAVQLVELAEKAARAVDATRVKTVVLKIGALSGVAEEALRFSYDIATAGTLLAGSRLDVLPIPVTVHCRCCGDMELSNMLDIRCPRCQLPTSDIRTGRELDLESIEVE
jgi:hydrogenase nickel incorporation protein HypA/HybF